MSNWNKLKQKIGTKPVLVSENESPKLSGKKRRAEVAPVDNEEVTPLDPEEVKLRGLLRRIRDKAVGLDCEMVGTGADGKVSELARCSMVDGRGNVLYDEFVQPKSFVTDFRTRWSGIRKQDINKSTAVPLEKCQEAVAEILKRKILVGHALHNDLTCLMLSHPHTMIRDTARYTPYMRKLPSGKKRPRALRDLVRQHLRKTIQEGEHDSVEDARCAMELYMLQQREWEISLREKKDARLKGASKAQAGNDVAPVVSEADQATSTEVTVSSSPEKSKKRKQSTEGSQGGKRPRLFGASDALFDTAAQRKRVKTDEQEARKGVRSLTKAERREKRKQTRKQKKDNEE